MQRISKHARLHSPAIYSCYPISFLGESINIDALSTANKCHVRLTIAQEWPRGITWWRVLRITLTPVASPFACITNSKLKVAVVLEWRFSSASSQLAFPILHLLLFEEAASWKQLYGSSLTGMFSCHCWSKFCDLRAVWLWYITVFP